MTRLTDAEYFAERAVAERKLSDAASDPAVALIHTNLAERYAALAADPRPVRQQLRIVTGG